MSASSELVRVANGGFFNTRVDGAEGGPWIVLSNSLATDLTLWDEFVAVMAGRYRILRYDQRGHGGSVATPPPYSMPMLVADVLAIMDVVGIDRAHFVGISMGASTGWGLALQHAKRLRSLTVCDGAVRAAANRDWQDRLDIVQQQGLATLVEPTLLRWFTPRSIAENSDAVRRVRAMIGGTSEDGFVGCVNALQTYDYSQGLESIDLPVLLVAGEHDGTRPAAMALDAKRVPGARFEPIRDAGHLSNIENPAEFNRIVSGFINSI